jgi:hypothetical protein
MNPNIFPHHFAMYAAEVFYELHNGRYPGSDTSMTEHLIGSKPRLIDFRNQNLDEPQLPDWEEDANNLIEIAEDLVVESKAAKLPDDELLLDACREL